MSSIRAHGVPSYLGGFKLENARIKRSRFPAISLLILIILFGIDGQSFAQETTGELAVTVRDGDGSVVPGASVTFTKQDSGRTWSGLESTPGTLKVVGLEVGRYSVRVEKRDFSPLEFRDVSVSAGARLELDAVLKIAPLQQTLTVIDHSPLLDMIGTSDSHHVPAEEFERIPKARSFQSIFALLPSVNSGVDQYGNVTGVEGGYQVNGASAAENLYLIDGVTTNSLIQGQFRQNAVFEILQNVQVKTVGADAEYGGALGGVISAVTRSGGNAYHGDIHYYYSGDDVSAGPVKRLLLDPVTQSAASFVQDQKQDDRRDEAGASLGGYIRRDTLWFFVAGSPQWHRQAANYLFSNGTQSGSIHQNQLYQDLFAKVSYDPLPKVRTVFTWLNTPTYSTGRLPAYNSQPNVITSSLAANIPNQHAGFSQAQTSYSGALEFDLSPKSILSIRAGRFWDDYKDTGIPSVAAVQYSTSALAALPADLLATVPAALQQPAGFNNTPRLQRSAYDITTQTFVKADFTRTLLFGGTHDLKLGVGYRKEVNKADNTYPGGGFVTIFWGQSFTSSLSPPCNVSPAPPACHGTYGYYRVDDFGTQGSAGAGSAEMYIQDYWRVRPRLTLGLGLRTEDETVPSFRRDLLDYAFRFGFKDKLAPRLGFAYDVTGAGKLKVSASWGLYYDWFKYQTSRSVFGGSVWDIYYRALNTPDVFSLSRGNMPGADLWDPSTPNSFQNSRPLVYNNNCSSGSLQNCIAPDLKPLSTAALNTAIEYQWGTNTVLRANYVHNNLRHTIEDLSFVQNGVSYSYIANPGEGVAKITPPSGATTEPIATPKPIRTYDAMELSLSRRFARSWFVNASYVYSRLYGNYAGLADTDEIVTPTLGQTISAAQQQSGVVSRPGTNTSRAWDLDQLLFDSHGHLDVKGRLPTDRPNSFKLYGSYKLPFGTEVGGFFLASSGTPISTYVNTTNGVAVFVNGRGDMGRTPVLSRTDLMISHEIKLGESRALRLEFNALNVFNQKTALHFFNCLNEGCNVTTGPSSAINLKNVDLFQGYDYRAMIQAQPGHPFDPRYGQPDLFQPGFAGRVGIKFVF